MDRKPRKRGNKSLRQRNVKDNARHHALPARVPASSSSIFPRFACHRIFDLRGTRHERAPLLLFCLWSRCFGYTRRLVHACEPGSSSLGYHFTSFVEFWKFSWSNLIEGTFLKDRKVNVERFKIYSFTANIFLGKFRISECDFFLSFCFFLFQFCVEETQLFLRLEKDKTCEQYRFFAILFTRCIPETSVLSFERIYVFFRLPSGYNYYSCQKVPRRCICIPPK